MALRGETGMGDPLGGEREEMSGCGLGSGAGVSACLYGMGRDLARVPEVDS